MNSFQKRLQDHLGLIRLAFLLLFVGLNLFSVHRMFSVSLLLAVAHIIVAVVLLLAAILIHQIRPRQMLSEGVERG
jgi:heme A synthase